MLQGAFVSDRERVPKTHWQRERSMGTFNSIGGLGWRKLDMMEEEGGLSTRCLATCNFEGEMARRAVNWVSAEGRGMSAARATGLGKRCLHTVTLAYTSQKYLLASLYCTFEPLPPTRYLCPKNNTKQG